MLLSKKVQKNNNIYLILKIDYIKKRDFFLIWFWISLIHNNFILEFLFIKYFKIITFFYIIVNKYKSNKKIRFFMFICIYKNLRLITILALNNQLGRFVFVFLII